VVGRHAGPKWVHFFNVLAQHAAGLDLAVGVVPLVGALVAAGVFVRKGFPARALPFAAVAASLTLWVMAEVAYSGAAFDHWGHDNPRIHERFLIYLVPFFLIALFSTLETSAAKLRARWYVAAGAVAALLPLAIPFHAYVTENILVDTFGLQPFAFPHAGVLRAVPYAKVAAVVAAALLSLLLARARNSQRAVLALVLLPSLVITGMLLPRIASGSAAARALLPARFDWVDAAKPKGPVALLGAWRGGRVALETAYSNYSISRIYYLCDSMVGPEFGETKATIEGGGRLAEPGGYVRAAYVVAPTWLGLHGRVVARNRRREVLVVPPPGPLVVSAPRSALQCPRSP
jgi:hypothetical protein